MFAENLRSLRQAAGLTQQKLADEMGVSRTAVYKWEMRQGQPDIGMLRRLAERFQVTIDQLCGDAAEMNTEEQAPDTLQNIAVMTRAFRQLTPEEQEKYLAVGRALFAHAFGEEKR